MKLNNEIKTDQIVHLALSPQKLSAPNHYIHQRDGVWWQEITLYLKDDRTPHWFEFSLNTKDVDVARIRRDKNHMDIKKAILKNEGKVL